MVTEAEKRSAKAKKTRKANLLAKAAESEKYKRALSRARNAENKLKAYKQGLKDGLAAKRGEF